MVLNAKQLFPHVLKKIIKDFIKYQVTAEAQSQTTRLRRTIEQIARDEVRKQLVKERPARHNYGDNLVVNHPVGNKCNIKFNGKNNILYVESKNRTLEGLNVYFEGNNAVVYISDHMNKNQKYRVKIFAHNNTVVYIGKNVDFHISNDDSAYMIASEGRNIIVGDDCLFSINTWFRTSDGHAAYDIQTKKRINPAKSIFIGDHVWIGQRVTILKGARIGSGSIIGANSIVPGKEFPSNSSFAGAPAREIKSGLFYTRPNINSYFGNKIKEIEYYDNSDWIYTPNTNTDYMQEIDDKLLLAKSSQDKLSHIKKYIANNKYAKNRFFVGSV